MPADDDTEQGMTSEMFDMQWVTLFIFKERKNRKT